MNNVLRRFEVTAAALAIISGAALMLSIILGGFIDPNAIIADSLAYGLMLLFVALGVTLDALAPNAATKAVALAMLTLGALLLTGWFAISFIITFGIPALLAIIATILAYARLGARPAAPAIP